MSSSGKAVSRILVVLIMLVMLTAASFLGIFAARGMSANSATTTSDTIQTTSSTSQISSITTATTTADLVTSSSLDSTTETSSTTTLTTSNFTTTTTATSCPTTGTYESGIWTSQLRGVNYVWDSLFEGDNPTSPPAQAFPLLKSFGFNFVRVPLSWNIMEENATAYLGYLSQVATAADSAGLYVVYDAHTSGSGAEPGSFFPASLNATYGSGTSFLTSWWEQNVTYDGQPGWKALWSEFWQPVLSTVNCHASTLGYELENEPRLLGAPTVSLQQFNEEIGSEMRAVTNKYIIIMGVGEGMNTYYDSLAIPTGVSNIVIDAHCYVSQSVCVNPVTLFNALSNFSKTSGIPVFIGEWNVYDGCCITENQSQIVVDNLTSLFKQYDFGNNYWAWRCTPTKLFDSDLLTGANCQPFWLTYQVSSGDA